MTVCILRQSCLAIEANNLTGTWNAYAEFATSLAYDDWPGSAKGTSFRINLTKTLPVGF
jgi:hypothetical protein